MAQGGRGVCGGDCFPVAESMKKSDWEINTWGARGGVCVVVEKGRSINRKGVICYHCVCVRARGGERKGKHLQEKKRCEARGRDSAANIDIAITP